MEFEWDEVKNRTNIDKHGLSFDRAIVLFDGFYLNREDKRLDYGERRSLALGLLDGVAVVLVVYTVRAGRIRMISARPANQREREIFYEALQNRTDG
jgi:hypothetical protein